MKKKLAFALLVFAVNSASALTCPTTSPEINIAHAEDGFYQSDFTGTAKGDRCLISATKIREVITGPPPQYEWEIRWSRWACGGTSSDITTFGESGHGTTKSCYGGCVQQVTKIPYIAMHGSESDSYYAAFTNTRTFETGESCTETGPISDDMEPNDPNQMDGMPCPSNSAYGTVNGIEVCVPQGNNAPPGFEPKNPTDPNNPTNTSNTPFTNNPGDPAPPGTPRPDGSTVPQPGEDPDGNGVGNGNGEGEEGSLCADSPDILACKKLEAPQNDDIPKRDQAITAESNPQFSGDGNCPADVVVTIGGQQITVVSTSAACGWISSFMRPIILLLAAISAAFIVVPKAE